MDSLIGAAPYCMSFHRLPNLDSLNQLICYRVPIPALSFYEATDQDFAQSPRGCSALAQSRDYRFNIGNELHGSTLKVDAGYVWLVYMVP